MHPLRPPRPDESCLAEVGVDQLPKAFPSLEDTRRHLAGRGYRLHGVYNQCRARAAPPDTWPAAERAGASYYAVRQPPDLRWHVPSVEYDPQHSPALAAFVAHVDTVVTVHGYGREGLWATLLVGGGSRPLATRLGGALRTALGDGFTVLDDLASIPRPLRGLHPRNPVNLPAGGGAQLELPPRVRSGTGVPTFDPAYEQAVVAALVSVALAQQAWPGGGSPTM